MQITLDIKDSALDKILYFLEHLQDDVKIIPHTQSINFEVIDENDPDFQYVVKARQRREDGEKSYSIDEMIQEFK